MRQTVYYANDRDEEYARLPDPTRPQQLAVVGYLLFDGPLDGTAFSGFFDPDDPRLADAVAEKVERERRIEAERCREYIRDQPGHVVRRFERETFERVGEFDYGELDEFRAFAAKQAQSTYRNDDGTWDRQGLARVAAADFHFTELFDYLGRWHDAPVRLVLDEQAVAGYTDVTDDVIDEMHRTVPDSFLETGEGLLTPDFVGVASDDGGGDGDGPDASGTGSGDRELFPINGGGA